MKHQEINRFIEECLFGNMGFENGTIDENWEHFCKENNYQDFITESGYEVTYYDFCNWCEENDKRGE